MHFSLCKLADVSNSNYQHENRVRHDENLRLAKIYYLEILFNIFFVFPSFNGWLKIVNRM